MIPAQAWNKMLAHLRSHCTPLPGLSCLLSRSNRGHVVRAGPNAGKWRHPFHVTPQWNKEKNYWEADINPGLLDGEDPIIPDPEDDEKSIIDHSLPLAAAIWPMRPPPFFAKLGVRDPTEGISLDGSGVAGVSVVDQSWRDELRPPPRLLARADVVLQKARAALAGDVMEVPVASGFDVIYSVKYNTSRLEALGERGRIITTPLWLPPTTPTLMDRLLGNYEEPQEDAILLATVWLLSPPNSEPVITSRWKPMVRHRVFWNLRHVAPLPVIPPVSSPITLQTGLAGGLADSIFNQMLATNNRESQRIISALNAISPGGRFFSV